jgi:CheY-like chemotaxis protein
MRRGTAVRIWSWVSAPPRVVLVVDDDGPVREALVELLSARGCEVWAAGDGEGALGVIASGVRPCAVLLDWEMPGVDGAGFLERRAVSAELSAIPVYVSSAAALPPLGDEVQALAPKPLDVGKLLALLGRTCVEHCTMRDACEHFHGPPARR